MVVHVGVSRMSDEVTTLCLEDTTSAPEWQGGIAADDGDNADQHEQPGDAPSDEDISGESGDAEWQVAAVSNNAARRQRRKMARRGARTLVSDEAVTHQAAVTHQHRSSLSTHPAAESGA
jgi:hypothetical protein